LKERISSYPLTCFLTFEIRFTNLRKSFQVKASNIFIFVRKRIGQKTLVMLKIQFESNGKLIRFIFKVNVHFDKFHMLKDIPSTFLKSVR